LFVASIKYLHKIFHFDCKPIVSANRREKWNICQKRWRTLLNGSRLWGISFATHEKLNTFRYGSELVNFSGDKILEGGLATAGYDDNGANPI
jgi:hypothetical protein